MLREQNIYYFHGNAQNNTASSASPTATLTMTVATTSAGLTATTTQQAMATTSQQIKPTPTTTSAPSASVSLDFVVGVNLGDYKATEEECKAKCCGTGGPITVRRSCTDENGNKSPKCLNYRIKKEVKDCNSVCNVKDLCGGELDD
ncbi:hypothetical protein AC249_AIPGENE16452 [Exaiptasia diaphana]|nr:hypothetical protein AC249_AIPGENE16452 [Exaiptasia diaphana]